MLNKRVCITGGAGYVGSQLVPYLINHHYKVTVLDNFWYMKNPFSEAITKHPNLKIVHGDIRDSDALYRAFAGQEAVIHLACVSNDPSFEMNPSLGKAINLDSFPGILDVVKTCKVSRFIYASSSSVYGVKNKANVQEDDTCEPLTDYSKYKLECEEILKRTNMNDVCWSIIRPATICGYSRRMRFDLSVNILTLQALKDQRITVFGGAQLRPNLNINDMIRAYDLFLRLPEQKIHREIFNIGFENKSILEIAHLVRDSLKFIGVSVEVQDTQDPRSYHISAEKAWRKLDFSPIYTLRNAIDSIALGYSYGLFTNPMTNSDYYNIRKMKELKLV